MNAPEKFTLQPTHPAWPGTRTARGQLRDQPLPLPTGVDSLVFDRVHLTGVDFADLRFTGFHAHGSTFERCDFSGVTFDQIGMGTTSTGPGTWNGRAWPQTVYRDCVFRRTRFPPHTHFGNVRFERCLFDRSRLRDQTDTLEAEFVDCVFLGRVRGVNFWGRPTNHLDALGRNHNDFTGNDFTGADLEDVSFRHIDLRSQRFPGLPGYALLDDIGERTRSLLPLIDAWPDERQRQMARLALGFLAGTAREWNDDQALVRPEQMGRKLPPALRQELFDALRCTSTDTGHGPAAAPGAPGHAGR